MPGEKAIFNEFIEVSDSTSDISSSTSVDKRRAVIGDCLKWKKTWNTKWIYPRTLHIGNMTSRGSFETTGVQFHFLEVNPLYSKIVFCGNTTCE